MTPKMKIAMYLRLSIEDKKKGMDESNSIANQRKLITDYIAGRPELAGNDVCEYCDDGFSGTNLERPGMKKLLETVKSRQIQCIIVKDMSRFSRDYIELGTYLNQIFPFLGIRFISVNDFYDSKEQKGTTVAIDTAFQSLVYDLYSKDLSLKLKAAFKSRSDAGEYVFAQLPFGYERNKEIKNQVVVNEKEAKIVRRIFSLAADGKGTTEIARILHREGIPTAMQMRGINRSTNGEKLSWSAHKVRRILNNRFYIGDMVYGKSVRESVGSGKAVMLPRSEWKVIKGHHEPLVSPEIFRLVSASCQEQAKHQGAKKHPLIGKVFCGGCGYAVNYKMPSWRKHDMQLWCRKHSILGIPECCTYFNGTILEETVLLMLNHELMKRGDVEEQSKYLERFQKEHMEALEKSLKECRQKQKQIQKDRNGLYEGYAANKITAEEYRRRADCLETKIQELRKKEEELEAEYSQTEEEYRAKKQDMKQIIRYAHIEKLTQEVVDTFIKKIYVYKDKRVEIEWNFSEGLGRVGIQDCEPGSIVALS